MERRREPAMAESPTDITDQLRRWAHGLHTTEAATELLIRAHNGASPPKNGHGSSAPTDLTGSTTPPSPNTSTDCPVVNNGFCGSPPPSAPTRQPQSISATS